MKLSIVRENGIVVVDGLAYDGLSMESIDQKIHAVQWDGHFGTVEYNPDENGKIDVVSIDNIDQFQFVVDEWQAAYDNAHKPPTEDELKNECKAKAKYLLVQTDWSVLPDVTITNKVEFESYRQQIRQFVFSPVVDPVWPTEPTPVWE